MEYAEVNFMIEMINGAIFIIVLSMASCLMFYVSTLRHHLNLTVSEVLFNAPLGIRLAIPMLIFKLGLLLALGVGWYWRLFGGQEMPLWQIRLFLIAIVIILIGGFWLIRILTFFRSGESSWIITMIIIMVYFLLRFSWKFLL